jgi:nascent polypeptide-associated complex subunit alpha
MFGGIDPSKIQGMMKKMGIKQEEIDASRVIIENPNVVKINMQGQDSFQITGDISEEEDSSLIKEEDIEAVMEKTGKNKKEAQKALEEANGDLAEAILALS